MTRLTEIGFLLIWALAIIGYIANAYKLTDCDFDSPYKAETFRVIGIVIPPVGAVMGFVDIED
jgi:hypothetical protein